MERSFRYPRGNYHGREAGPWFTRIDIPHENCWAGRPFPRWGQAHQDPRWSQEQQDPRWGQGPSDPQWGHHNPQWDYFNPRWSQDHQDSQCYPPPPQWDQYHLEQPSRDYDCGFDNGNFQHRGGGSYRRRSHGRFYGKRSSSSYKGKNSSCGSSHVLVKMQQSGKENDSDVKKDESAISKETKQVLEDSVASVKNTDPLQVNQKASKAIISPSQFSFRLPPDSLTCPAKTKDTELIKLGTGSKTEDSHQVACCIQAVTSELPAALENLELKKEDEETELDKLKGAQASQATSLSSAKAPMEGQAPSNTAGGCHPVVKKEPMPATEAHHSPVASLASAEVPTGKQAPTEIMEDSCPVVKEKPDTEAHSYQAATLASDETPTGKQVPSKVAESVHPMVKEEPVLV
ncbi:uncharacterized protein LOC132567317 [Heteronotia binoei]|uniref:uncharacterized protein LOC132567317 n=1 Tax=Heteronotia binoei TaxID=13085 RepID=UPI00292E802C|nr:uncharacterized protein LOC132567317 [Heteronotia binoei]